MIRRARAEDVSAVVRICSECFPASHWAGLLDFDTAATAATVSRLVESEDAAVFFSERGALALVASPLWFSTEPVALELFFWSLDGSGTALRKAGETWAAEQGLRVVLMGSHEPGPTDRIATWYRRGGYAAHGHTYRKVLSDGH